MPLLRSVMTMKAALMTARPNFPLMTQADIVSFYHLQMPRWLFSHPKYKTLSLEAKVAYTFLLNRFQLSRLNGWINEKGEVFVIFTRKSLAEEMQINYRKAIKCFKELAETDLIWEQRLGRGYANQIYLALVQLEASDAQAYTNQRSLWQRSAKSRKTRFSQKYYGRTRPAGTTGQGVRY